MSRKLHSGLNVEVCIKPADPDLGIVFKEDLKENNLVYPNFKMFLIIIEYCN